MSESPSIVTARQRCALECSVTYWRQAGSPDAGQVRRCEHGRIWMATGRKVTGKFFLRLDDWKRLYRFWTPIAYRRAVRALKRSPIVSPQVDSAPCGEHARPGPSTDGDHSAGPGCVPNVP